MAKRPLEGGEQPLPAKRVGRETPCDEKDQGMRVIPMLRGMESLRLASPSDVTKVRRWRRAGRTQVARA